MKSLLRGLVWDVSETVLAVFSTDLSKLLLHIVNYCENPNVTANLVNIVILMSYLIMAAEITCHNLRDQKSDLLNVISFSFSFLLLHIQNYKYG